MIMKKFPLAVAILFVLFLICLDGQGYPERKKKISAGWEMEKVDERKPKGKHVALPERNNISQVADTVYSLGTKKKNLWLTPCYIISEKEAINKPLVIRFTNKNKAGYYRSLEILGLGLRPNNVGFTMTVSELLPDSLIATNSVMQSLSSAFRLDFVPDFTGEHVLQERLYDVDNRLLGYIVHNYDKDYLVATEHYFGPDGLPIKLAESQKHPNGLRLNVMFDRNGNDSLLYLTDGVEVVPNKDGAFYLQFSHSNNDKGERIKIRRSLDMDFSPMIDGYGNCGGIYVFDRYMNDSIGTLIDDHDNIMVLPESAKDKSMINVSTRKLIYDYDKWSLGAVENYGLHGEPVQNIMGTHKIVVEYDSLCREILRKGLDLQGNLAPINEENVAYYTVKWDTLGNVIEYHQFDINCNPISEDGSNSSFYKTFDLATNKMISNVGYVYDETSGKEVLDYRFIYSDAVDSMLFSDKTQKIVRYDSLGRTTSIRFLDSAGNPDAETYCAVDSTCFISGIDLNKSVNTEFRADGSVKSINVYDSLNNTKTNFRFDNKGFMTDSYQHRYDHQGKIIGQTDCNGFGVPCRNGGNSGVRYLYANVSKTFDGSYNVYNIVDEFGEPDYLTSSDGLIYSSFGSSESRFGNNIYRDEFGTELSKRDYVSLRDSLPKVMSVEVIDSVAYMLGLKDNDVILKYGDYKVDINNPLSERNFKVQWALRSVLDALDAKDMVIFRVEDADAGKFGLVNIQTLKGSPSELGFIPHIRYLTQRQRDRILDSMEKVGFDPQCMMELPSEGHYAVIGFNEMYRTMRYLPYQSVVKDAAILLGAVDIENGCFFSGLDGLYDDEALTEIVESPTNNLQGEGAKSWFFFSTDGGNAVTLDRGGKLFTCHLTDADYDKIKSLYSQVQSEMSRQLAERKPMDRNKFSGYWIIQPQDSVAFNPEGYLYFDKNGSMLGEISYVSLVPSEKTEEKVGSPLFKVTKSLNGNYVVGETKLKFKSENKYTPDYKCISVLDAAEDIDSLTVYFTRDVAKYTSWYENRMEYLYDVSEGAVVKLIDKRNLILTDTDGNDVHFVKIKGKPDVQQREKLDKNSLIGSWFKMEDEGCFALDLVKDGNACLRLYMLIMDWDGALAVWTSFPGIWWIENNDLKLDFDLNSIGYTSQSFFAPDSIDNSEEFWRQFESKILQEFKEKLSKGMYLVSLKDGILEFDETKLQYESPEKICILATVEDKDGYLAQQGLDGSFIVLKWCDWSCSDSIEEYKEELEKQKDNPKELILLPVSSDDDGNDVFGIPFAISAPEGVIGVTLRDLTVQYGYYLTQIESRLNMLIKLDQNKTE